MTTDTECQRCGTCCKAGGPALHLEDIELVQSGKLPLQDLYTIRTGEMARDNVKGTLSPVATELIKIRGVGRTWTCCYYDEDSKGCTVYDNRPLECRLLNCRDTAAIEAVYEKGRLTRKDLLADVPQMWDLVTDHEKKCGYKALAVLAEKVKAGSDTAAINSLVEMVGYDQHLRELIREKGQLDTSLLEFLFGRPMQDTLPGFGLKARQEGGKLIVSPV